MYHEIPHLIDFLTCNLFSLSQSFLCGFFSSLARNPCATSDGRSPCSHLCLINFNQTFSCACPHLMKLQPDKRTCKGKDTYWYSQTFSHFLIAKTSSDGACTHNITLSYIIHIMREKGQTLCFAGIFCYNCNCYGALSSWMRHQHHYHHCHLLWLCVIWSPSY